MARKSPVVSSTEIVNALLEMGTYGTIPAIAEYLEKPEKNVKDMLYWLAQDPKFPVERYRIDGKTCFIHASHRAKLPQGAKAGPTRTRRGSPRKHGAVARVREILTMPMTSEVVAKKAGLTSREASNSLHYLKTKGEVVDHIEPGSARLWAPVNAGSGLLDRVNTIRKELDALVREIETRDEALAALKKLLP